MTDIIVLIGAGSIGQAIARRVGAGKHILLADIREENAEAAAQVLQNAGFTTSTTVVDVSKRASVEALVNTATSLGNIAGLIPTAGVSPTQASIETILKVDLYGTALVLEAFGKVVTHGASGVVISSMAGHFMKPISEKETHALATTPVESLLNLPLLQPDQIENTTQAYIVSKYANAKRVLAEAVNWGKRGARINTISPGIIITPLANDELNGPLGDGYRNMIHVSTSKRAGTPDEVANVAALLMGSDGGFITGSDFLMDGGVTAEIWFGALAAH